MATGGSDDSLRFNTTINTDGFEDGTPTFLEAMDRLTEAVDRLSTNILNRFNGAGQAMVETASGTESVSNTVETTGDVVDKLAARVKSLQERMGTVSVHGRQDSALDVASPAPITASVATLVESLSYDPKTMAVALGEGIVQI